MKKFLATGLLAIFAIALSQQQASAWVNAKFGVGLNWNYQSGGNTWGWGAWRNGQPPGPESLNSGPFQPYGPVFPTYGAPSHSSFDAPMMDAGYYAQGAPQFAPAMPQYPAQFATYPRPVYYYYGR
jgi:hypothetical protein